MVAVEDRSVPKIEDERDIIVEAPGEIAGNALLLMADIFPTGYFAGGGGPAGLCAHVNAEDHKLKNLLAVDSLQSRLDLAKSLGGEPWNFQTDKEGLDKRIKELTDDRGADVVI
ncbi:MAG: hypothetical protein Q9185_004896 [Variospora sp. 1 TL-2023]